MKRTIHIEHYRDEGSVVLYTVRLDGNADTETNLFLLRFMSVDKYKKDLRIIVRFFDNIGKKGAEERNFRPEGQFHAVPIDTSRLRLYCIRLSKNCIVFGGGGLKTSQKVQNSPDAFPHFELMRKTEVALNRALELGQIELTDDGHLIGELKLNI